MLIEDLSYRIVFDSRGNKTVECEVRSEEFAASAIAPAGASTGTEEAVVKDVSFLEEVQEKVSKALIGMSVFDQQGVDRSLREIDGTQNFSGIGGNFAITASLAVAKLASQILGLPLYIYIGGAFATELPYPLGNVIGGGAHAKGSTSIQEFLVIPVGAKSFFDAQAANTLAHKRIREEFDKRGIFAAKGDEGGWAAQITDDDAFEIIKAAISKVEDEVGIEMRMGIDVAATELWNGKEYVYGDKELTTEEQITYMAELADSYNLLYIEDPLHENDFDGFAELTRAVDCMVCGDDLFTTNINRIKRGLEIGAANTVLIKPNQIGTLTDTFKAVKLAKEGGCEVVVSHRSGETEDETIAHLAIAFNATLIKTGVVGGERIAKLNELIRIESEIEHSSMVKIRRL
jgi:enolase